MPNNNKYETLFFNALRDLFVGAKIEGESGYINLMKIKAGYFENGVSGKLLGRINEVLQPFPDFREETFDKLYTFFQRYFSESGSIYFRHTAVHQNVYEKVYTDDRDVVLFWKTHMLYYVKTDRIFNSMGVEMDGFKFYFDAGKMTLKKSNEKRETIYAFRAVDGQGQLVFEVTYSEKGRKTRMDDILKDLKKADIKINDETLTKAFRVFEKQSEVDYFINKDARSFLREQFDIWLYQYLFAGQNIWMQERLAQLQALKEIAFNIIDFISQFEDELVKVWNKPKFVRNSHYVLTLDKLMPIARDGGEKDVIASRAAAKQSDDQARITAPGTEPPSRNDIFERILAHPHFEQQVQEWRDLGMLGTDFRMGMLTEKDLTGAPAFPKYQYLPLDTQYFSDLELDILALFDDLDAALDGWLVHSENYQALNTLLPKFQTRVKAIYIDPPYNTDASEIIYENNYKDSAWITLIENRLTLAKEFLSRDGILCATIDDFELNNLRALLNTVFTEYHFIGTIAIRNNPAGRSTAKGFSISHEYALFVSHSLNSEIGRLERTEKQIARYGEKDDFGQFEWVNFRKHGGANARRLARPKLYYPIFVSEKTWRIPRMTWNEDHRTWDLNEVPKNYEKILYPVALDGEEKTWKWGHETVKDNSHDLTVRRDQQGELGIYMKSRLNDDGLLPTTFWDKARYSASDYGTNLLTNIFGKGQTFSFPKSVHAVEDCLRVANCYDHDLCLDFFAGSGTTAHAVMNLNRSDGGKRKYIMVEMGEHFNTVILPRVKKVAFSSSWKDGKANGGQGLSHFVKYYDLEQYEETLKQAHYQDSDLFDNPYEKPWEHYIFLRDEKMLAALDVDIENNSVQVHPERLYSDIDLAETLSQRRGKWIKRITAETVEFEDGEILSLTDPDWSTLKPLIWW